MNRTKSYCIILSAFLLLFGACKNKNINPDSFKISNERVEAEANRVTIKGNYSFVGVVEGMTLNLGLKENLVDAESHEVLMEGTSFSVTVENLMPDTTYYYRYSVDFGTNDEFLTETNSFRTLVLTDAPTVETVNVVRIDSTTVRVYCKVLNEGGDEVTERGIYWSTHNDPTDLDSITPCPTAGIGEYICELSGLAESTQYHVRAYAKNSYGIGKGDVLPFMTGAAPGAPQVLTVEVINVTANSAQCQGNVTADGGSPLFERGVCWSTLPNPTVNDNHEALGNGLGNYIVTVSGLYPNTTYHVRCYATNRNGTGYGEDMTFTTEDGTPTVITSSVTTITATTAKGGGNVTSSGAGYVNERGICWSKSHGFDLSNCIGHRANGGGEGSFTVDMDNLETNQTYYVKAYATNDYGTAYGDEVSFIPTDGLPIVTMDSVRDVSQISAKGYGTVIYQGTSDVTERGICWGTSDNPTLDDCLGHAHTGTGTGSFACVMEGLEPNSTYHVNAYAKNSSKGTAYGEPISFTTLQPEYYTINVSANPSNGGTVSGGGSYSPGQSCTVHATANSGYAFINWTENGNEVSTNANYTFTVNNNRDLVANFTPTYTISVSASPSSGGTVSGGGTYNDGQSCTVTATANSGYAFVNWTEGNSTVSEDPNYTFVVNSNRTLVAHFETQAPNTYTINVSASPSNGGTVSGGGSYNQGQSCTVHAQANSGYTFTNWTENGTVVSTSADYTFTVTSNRTLVAHFTVQNYTISVSASPSNGGSVSGGGTYNHGQSCTVHATAASGYTFTNWTEGNTVVSTNANYTFTVNSNHTLVAHFTAQTYTISVSANPSNGGTVSGGGTYQQGQSCTVHANANSGYTFTNWTENGSVVSTNANYNFTVTGNRTLVANFTAQSYTINVSANPSNGGAAHVGSSTGPTSGTYSQGQSCTVYAVANSGYTFSNWTENGNVVSSNANYTFNVTGNRNLVANFTAQSYTINVSASPSNGGAAHVGSSTGPTSGTYTNGQSCTVYATANSGYTFTNWTENGNVVSTNANYTFTVTGSRTLVANFTVQTQTYTINVSASPSNGGAAHVGSSTGPTSGTYTNGQSCTVYATANSGYTFLRWTENGNQVSTNPNYTFTVTGNRTLVAQFQTQTYTISVSASPSNGGTVSGGGTYQQGQSCTLTAIANSGYLFDHWTCNGQTVSGGGASYTFTVTQSATYIAYFTTMPQAPTGAVPGLFSVSATQQVWFSNGNLQYIGSSQTWKFADHQWTILGNNGQGGTSQTVNRDLFGWGTSGYNHGATCYQPWSTSTNNNDYYAYGSGSYNLYDQTGQADWGYHAISNGGGTTNTWRTLTNDEWNYVFSQRTTLSGKRFAKAQVNNVSGVILLPDNWDENWYTLASANSSGVNYTTNVITSTQWSTLEQHGAVFLPAAGYREGTTVNLTANGDPVGYYWSSARSTNATASCVYITKNSMTYNQPYYRYWGQCVRLVRPAGN
jgi:hypothetical protein